MTTVGGPTIDPGRFGRRTRGIALPLAATLVAFVIGGLVVAATGHNPLSAYKAIFDGTGLNWLFPWVSGFERQAAARDLQQTLLVMTPLILTACAVGFSFRAGMFNIGGQGQYWVGLTAALVVGTHLEGTATWLHVTLGMVAAITAGSIWGAIAGVLKATRGAHEVITTIMLNFVGVALASWATQYHYKPPGDALLETVPIGENAHIARLGRFVPGFPERIPLNLAFPLALVTCLLVYLFLWRTRWGYQIRATGANAEAAQYGGIATGRQIVLAMALSGALAGMVGINEVLGYRYRYYDSFSSGYGFTGIAVALLGRNHPVGVILASLLFGALLRGGLFVDIFTEHVSKDLVLVLQGTIILFVAAEAAFRGPFGRRIKGV